MQEYAAAITPIRAPEPAAYVRRGALAGTMALFAITMFLGSGLLFLIQPMFAKLILPLLGGSPSVWNTCVLFFQTTLLLGYLYAHLSTRWLGLRWQIVCHLALLVAPLVVLPLSAGIGQPPASINPVWWLLRTMTWRVGLPFFVVSTSAPLMQKWFALQPVPSARDPYFLYSASNLGSMVALLGYPLLVEPLVGTYHQAWLWSAGYVLLIALISICALFVWTCAGDGQPDTPAGDLCAGPQPGAVERLRWVGLSFVPSTLMLGVTTHISTDIAAVPMLWVGPLALYLVTFVLAFSRREVISHRLITRVLPGLILACLVTVLLNLRLASLIALHVVCFFAVAMVCHHELAKRRPAPHHLTEFYLWMAFGGMMGGVFSSLLAPRLFTGVLEYPLVLALAAAIRPSPMYRRAQRESLGLLITVPGLVLLFCLGLWKMGAFPADLAIRPLLLTFATVLAIAYIWANRTAPFGIVALLFVFVIAFGRPQSSGTILFAARSFFGVYRVVAAPDHSYHLLQHGSTTHGREQIARENECAPTGYYHPSSPIGQLMAIQSSRLNDVAIVGLGTGALACYAAAGSSWTFYEIDPLIEQIARNSGYFTYLQNTRGRVNVVLGDARMSLRRASERQFDLIVLDAFSSDAIPTHLLTQEAIALYLSRLRPDGIVAFHISNRYLNLEPLLGALADREGLFALANADDRPSEAESAVGKFPSHWVMLARTDQPLLALAGRQGWRRSASSATRRVWTDDYSNILQALAR